MPVPIEIDLRVPSFVGVKDGRPWKTDNSHVRFRRVLDVEGLPKVGEQLVLETATGGGFTATVTRLDWDDAKMMFVVACTFAARQIRPELYDALVNDPAWPRVEFPV